MDGQSSPFEAQRRQNMFYRPLLRVVTTIAEHLSEQPGLDDVRGDQVRRITATGNRIRRLAQANSRFLAKLRRLSGT